MKLSNRFLSATFASAVHLLASGAIALLASALVFLIWYPYPYRDLSGGKELFSLIISIDIVCGPLLTLVLFSPEKTKTALRRDMALVVLIQLGALGYGLWTVWQARPLYLVLEVDRFKVITRTTIDEAALGALPSELRAGLFAGPMVVGIREPKDAKEREKVMFESVQGGRDYADRPEFYVPYSPAAAAKSLIKARPLSVFLQKQPSQQATANELAAKKGADVSQWMYLPIIARQDWVTVLDKQGQIQGFLKGDGF